MKKLAKATGARSVTNLDDLTAKELGRADLVEERKVGTDDMTFVTGCKKARAVSILIRGGTEHVVDEVERILHDALRVVSAAIEDGKAIAGGGSAEIELSIALKDYAATVGGREQLAIEAFAGALDVIPRTLGENAGLDPIDALIKLRADHQKKGGQSKGLGLFQLPVRKGFDDLSPLARVGGRRGVPRHLEPETRRDLLGNHDARWRTGPGSRSLHPRRTPRCFDHRSHGVLHLVDGTT